MTSFQKRAICTMFFVAAFCFVGWLVFVISTGAKHFDSIKNNEQKILNLHTSDISGVCFHKDSKIIVTGSRDSTIVFYDLFYDKITNRINCQSEVVGIAISSDGGTLFAATGKAGTISRWDLPSLIEKPAYNLGCGEITGFAVNSAGDAIVAACRDGSIGVWKIDGERPQVVGKIMLSRFTRALVFSSDGNLVAFGHGSESGAGLWRVAKPNQFEVIGDNRASVESIAFIAQSPFLAAGTLGSVSIWDADKNRHIVSTLR